MPLESATYISDLNTSNPVGSTDKVQTLDDHVRLIKSTLKTTFPSVTGAVTPSHTELNLLDGLTGVTGSGNLVASASPTLTGTLTAAAGTFSGTVTGGGQILATTSFAFAGDSNTGIQGAADVLSVITGGSTRATFAAAEIDLTATALDFNGNADISGTLTLGGNMTVPTGWSLTTGGGTFTISGTGETLATFADDGAVTLYYDNASKLNTKTDGVNITGELECDTLDVDGNVAIDGTLTTPNTSALEPGFKGAPQNIQNGAYTLVLSDAGLMIDKASGASNTWTIPANASVAFPVGTVIVLANHSGNDQTIDIASDTLVLAGAGASGSRTLSGNWGLATITKLTSVHWIISGAGLS